MGDRTPAKQPKAQRGPSFVLVCRCDVICSCLGGENLFHLLERLLG